MMDGIAIGRDDLDALRRHALACAPDEACGVLLGRAEGDVWTVSRAVPTGNAAPSPVGFAIPEGELVAAYRGAAECGLDVVGVFHSHPGSEAVPSAVDVTYMRLNPVAWLIYSGVRDAHRAWKLEDGAVEIRLVATGGGA